MNLVLVVRHFLTDVMEIDCHLSERVGAMLCFQHLSRGRSRAKAVSAGPGLCRLVFLDCPSFRVQEAFTLRTVQFGYRSAREIPLEVELIAVGNIIFLCQNIGALKFWLIGLEAGR